MTQEGDPRDIVLVPGQQYIIQKRGLVIIQGLTEAKILVTLPSNRIFFYLELSRTRRIFL